MKNLLRKAGWMIALMFILTGALYAQEEQHRHHNAEGLTEEQKTAIQQHRDANHEAREAFKATLTEAQQEILRNPDLTREEKREALHATLSEAQQEMLQAHGESRHMNREAFRHGMSDEQRTRMREHRRAHHGDGDGDGERRPEAGGMHQGKGKMGGG